MSLRRNMGIPVPALYLTRNYYKHSDFNAEVAWVKMAIPEITTVKAWKDFQIVNIAMDYSTQIDRVSSFQIPFDTDLFKDFAITLWMFDLDGEYFRDKMGFDESDIRGIYKTFISHNEEDLLVYKTRIKRVLDDYFEINYKNKYNAHKGGTKLFPSGVW